MATKTQPEAVTEPLPLSKPLSPKLVAEVQECRNRIAAEFGKLKDAANRIARLEKLKEKLSRDIQSHETGLQPEDAQGATGLAGLREQLRIAISQLNSASNLTAPQLAALVKTLDPLEDLLHRALSAEFEHVIESITEVFRPYFPDVQRTRVAALQTDYVASLQWFRGRSWYTFPLDNAPRALAVLDALIAGRNPWRFDPCQESSNQD